MKNKKATENLERKSHKSDSKNEPVRIQKLLAQAGIGSRRQVEKWIVDGNIIVNGAQAKLGDKINVYDEVKLRGRLVKLAGKIQVDTQVLIYHKPIGEIVSKNDPEGRPTVFSACLD